MRLVVRWVSGLALAALVACAPSSKRIGPADAPRVGEVLNHPVHASTAQQMQHLILRELTDRYAADRGITVTQTEVEAYLADMRRVMQAERPGQAAAEDGAEVRAAREQAARAYILQHKIDAALQRQYGGRIAAKPGGAVPVDAYRRFLEEQAARGNFRIFDAAYEREFWRVYTDDSKLQFLPEGSEAARRAFEVNRK
jgi:hypothetical protein